MPRKRRSALTPAWKGTIKVMGREGKSWAPSAAAGATTPQRLAAATTSTSQARRCMLILLPWLAGLCCPVLGPRRLAYLRTRATTELLRRAGCRMVGCRRSGLHAPAAHGCGFDVAEDQIFHTE